ncbi:MAG TPA: zinc-binding dehydrogenase [Candidatus Thermoplasmatota archaeon]|nr:zinc-binding dehydrogenase [Candidatus Thermoplasmatota archaeon]
MRAAFIEKHGGLDEIRQGEIPRPEPGPGEVLVNVKAAALNRLDLFTLAGIPGLKLAMPHVLGGDAAGTVQALGPGVAGVRPGDRVAINPGLWCGECEACRAGEESLCRSYRIVGEHARGTLAEFVAVPARNLLPMPLGFPFEQAAAAPLVYQTAWRALLNRGQLRSGQTLLVVGAGGGLSPAAVQIARHVGARVIALTSNEEKAKRVKELGAEHVVNYREKPDWDREVWQLTGKRGVDVVFDNVGKETLAKSVRSCAKGGRVVVCGGTTGYDVSFDLAPIFWRQVSVVGSTMGSDRETRAVMDLVWKKQLRPVLDRVVPLHQAKEALRAMQAGETFGKIVLTI